MDIAAAVRREIPDVAAVYLFGSRATGNARPDSDWDVAVLARRPLDPVARWEIQERLAAEVHADVDLVDLRAASTVLRVQVIANGRLEYDGDPAERAHFEAIALSDYARLNEERRGILEDVKARGSVYG